MCRVPLDIQTAAPTIMAMTSATPPNVRSDPSEAYAGAAANAANPAANWLAALARP